MRLKKVILNVFGTNINSQEILQLLNNYYQHY